MLVLICLVALWWCTSKYSVDNSRSAADHARMREEWSKQQEAARIEAARLEALEREQMRQVKEQERQAKELAKHEAMLRKHEEEIRKLKNRMKTCEEDYKALKQRMENLSELYDLASKELASADHAGDEKRREKALRKVMTLDNQIAATEKKIAKAKFDWNTAQREIKKRRI